MPVFSTIIDFIFVFRFICIVFAMSYCSKWVPFPAGSQTFSKLVERPGMTHAGRSRSSASPVSQAQMQVPSHVAAGLSTINASGKAARPPCPPFNVLQLLNVRTGTKRDFRVGALKSSKAEQTGNRKVHGTLNGGQGGAWLS